MAGASALVAAEPGDGTPKGIRLGGYSRWTNAIDLFSEPAETRVVLLPELGGRIIRYQTTGENILWENRGTLGWTLAKSRELFLPGGYQLDIQSELVVATNLLLWNGPYKVKAMRDYTVALESEPDPETGLQLEKEFTMDPESGETGIIQRAKNISAKEMKVQLCARFICRGGGYAMFSLNKYSRLPARWGLRHIIADAAHYDHYKPECPQVTTSGQVLVAETKLTEDTKIGADSDGQWLAYVDGQLMFVIYYPFSHLNKYGEHGHTVQVSWGESGGQGLATVLQVLSAETTLAPGQTMTFPIKCATIGLLNPARTVRDAKKLVAKIPPSPFRLGIK